MVLMLKDSISQGQFTYSCGCRHGNDCLRTVGYVASNSIANPNTHPGDKRGRGSQYWWWLGWRSMQSNNSPPSLSLQSSPATSRTSSRRPPPPWPSPSAGQRWSPSPPPLQTSPLCGTMLLQSGLDVWRKWKWEKHIDVFCSQKNMKKIGFALKRTWEDFQRSLASHQGTTREAWVIFGNHSHVVDCDLNDSLVIDCDLKWFLCY